LPKAAPESSQPLLGFPNDPQTCRGDEKISLGPSASFRRRFTQDRIYKALLLKTLQGCVDRTACDGSASLLLDLARNRHAIRILAQPNYREHDHQLKFAETMMLGHFSDSIEEINVTPVGDFNRAVAYPDE